jgi:hypothetical protein
VRSLSRQVREVGTILALSMLISAAVPGAAAADLVPNGLADITLDVTTVNPQTGIGHVTVSVTCLAPAGLVRARATTVQIYGQGRYAVSFDAQALLSGCQAGQRVSLVLQFGGQQGQFVPGLATIQGFVETFAPPGVLSFGTRDVLLQPEH